MTHGIIRVGIGGWTYEPWRGSFYPAGLPQAREQAYATEHVTSIEINGTYYSSFKPDSWRKWADVAPDDFVYSIKASRFCTNRKQLAKAAGSIEKFVGQGMDALGTKMGPLLWQFMATKAFDPDDFEAFLKLLPPALLRKSRDGRTFPFPGQTCSMRCVRDVPRAVKRFRMAALI